MIGTPVTLWSKQTAKIFSKIAKLTWKVKKTDPTILQKIASSVEEKYKNINDIAKALKIVGIVFCVQGILLTLVSYIIKNR